METNVLYYGENLEILRKYIPDESIDLIYLDPPFKSKATYNVLFREPTGEPSQAQVEAFEDTWHWTQETERTFEEICQIAPPKVVDMVQAFRLFIGTNDMMAYLVMMGIRLLELKRVLKDTGSIYLHCDPTASHYLKLLMDAVFGYRNFLNEVIWQYEGPQSPSPVRFATKHDVIFRYAKVIDRVFASKEGLYGESAMTEEEAKERGYKKDEAGRWYYDTPKGDYTDESIERLEREGRVFRTRSGKIRIKHFLGNDADGRVIRRKKIADVWNDIPSLGLAAISREKLGYPTQKPEALLERIIKASSNEGDIVLDPFCGCGTAVAVAERLNRRWIGIDITHLAISIMKWRLEKTFPGIQYKVIGEPVDLAGAKALAEQDPSGFQFQCWALSLIGARPYGNSPKKGADTGIDGYYYFMDEPEKAKKAIVQVKSGHVLPRDVRDLAGVIDRERAEVGILLTLREPTKAMKKEAAVKGFYHSPFGKDYPRLQILTIEQCLKGKKPDLPPWVSPIPAPKAKSKDKQKELF